MLENTLETLEGLSDRRKALYIEKDGKFELDDDFRGEDISPLKNALQRQKDENAAAKIRQIELQQQIDDNALSLAEATGDKKEVERLKQEALDNQKSAHDAESAKDKKTIHNLTVGLALNSVAGEIYLHPNGVNLTPLESRIKLNDDGITTYFVNKLGETIAKAELITEFKGDETMAFAIKAGSGNGGGSGGGFGGNVSNKPLSDMTSTEKVAFHKAKMKIA